MVFYENFHKKTDNCYPSLRVNIKRFYLIWRCKDKDYVFFLQIFNNKNMFLNIFFAISSYNILTPFRTHFRFFVVSLRGIINYSVSDWYTYSEYYGRKLLVTIGDFKIAPIFCIMHCQTTLIQKQPNSLIKQKSLATFQTISY